MKKFTDLPPRAAQPITVPQVKNSGYFIKQKLLAYLERPTETKEAVFKWLLSFPTGMSKEEFMKQCFKLEQKHEDVLKQLALSEGSRTIRSLPRQVPPKLSLPITDALAEHRFIAIEAAAGRRAIEAFLDELPTTGGVYILDVNELVLEFRDYRNRGKASDIIEQANRASILVITGLEKPIILAYHIKDTLYQLAVVRKKDPDKYTLSTYNYTHTWYIPEFANEFVHFSI